MFFYSVRIRTLVAMATYSSHRLIMGKVEIDDFCQNQVKAALYIRYSMLCIG